MNQDHLDLQPQLDSQNISQISDFTTTPLCNDSPVFFLDRLESKTNEQTETINTVAGN